MEPEPVDPRVKLAKKFNLEAMQDYDFGNIDFDVNIGKMSQNDHKEVIKEAEKADAEDKNKNKEAKK